MKRHLWLGLMVGCLIVLLAACTAQSGDLKGATPVGFLRSIVSPDAAATPEPVTIAGLLEDPAMYEGQLVEVSGTYGQRGVVVCSTRPQRSPAAWVLSDGEEEIAGAGMNEQLSIVPSGQVEMTVVGRWLHWQGPVGCGRQAQIVELWYLDVSQVVSPNPITVAGLIGEGADVDIQLEPPGGPGSGYPGPGEGGQTSGTEITATLEVSGTVQPGLPPPAGTPILAPPTPSPVTSATAGPNNPTAVPTQGTVSTATPTSAAGNPTPTPSPAGGGSSPTPTTVGGASPTATTAGGGNGTTIDQEELPPGSLETAQIAPGEIHRWPLVVTSTMVITVNVATELALDTKIAIRGPSGNIVAQQNETQGAEPEVLAAVPLNELGTYDILITSENDVTGYYAILVLNQESYTFVFNGTLNFGEVGPAILRENNDQFWHFSGTAGQVVTITATPSDDSDLFLRLFGPNDTLLVDFHDDTGQGEVEEITSFTLPETGFYSLLIGEFDFGAASYSVVITLE